MPDGRLHAVLVDVHRDEDVVRALAEQQTDVLLDGVGALFGRTTTDLNKKELIFLITLRIFDGMPTRADLEAIEKTKKMEEMYAASSETKAGFPRVMIIVLSSYQVFILRGALISSFAYFVPIVLTLFIVSEYLPEFKH